MRTDLRIVKSEDDANRTMVCKPMTWADKLLQDLAARVARLEHAVFPKGKSAPEAKGARSDEKYNGATGGIRLLVDEGFFDKKRTFGDVCQALADKGYYYSKQAVQTPLNKLSSVKIGLLVGLKEQGKKKYARRK